MSGRGEEERSEEVEEETEEKDKTFKEKNNVRSETES